MAAITGDKLELLLAIWRWENGIPAGITMGRKRLGEWGSAGIIMVSKRLGEREANGDYNRT